MQDWLHRVVSGIVVVVVIGDTYRSVVITGRGEFNRLIVIPILAIAAFGLGWNKHNRNCRAIGWGLLTIMFLETLLANS